ncbi:thioesterase-like superfamily-domain-containing protein [Aspergillus egyptiacus]|nr:thioesterase-like superfamily-domain-containing protein [Aspergillus egyptiacus]
MAAPCQSAAFERAIAVNPVDANTYSAFLQPEWCIIKVPHGGYVASILYRTAATHLARRATLQNGTRRPQEPIGLQVSFLRRTFAGPAILAVEEIKLGARVSTVHVTLFQKKDQPTSASTSTDARPFEVKAVAYISLAPPDIEESPAVKGLWELSPPPPPGSLSDGSIDFQRLAQTGADGDWQQGPPAPSAIQATTHLKLYMPSSILFPKTAEERTKQIVDQWARFTPGGNAAAWCNEAVIYLADMFPAALHRLAAMEVSSQAPATSSGEAQFWYPTVTMNIDLKTRLPPQGVEWLYSRVVTRMLRGSRADLDVLILDQSGNLIATSTHVGLVVDAARNTKGRLDTGKL